MLKNIFSTIILTFSVISMINSADIKSAFAEFKGVYNKRNEVYKNKSVSIEDKVKADTELLKACKKIAAAGYHYVGTNDVANLSTQERDIICSACTEDLPRAEYEEFANPKSIPARGMDTIKTLAFYKPKNNPNYVRGPVCSRLNQSIIRDTSSEIAKAIKKAAGF